MRWVGMVGWLSMTAACGGAAAGQGPLGWQDDAAPSAVAPPSSVEPATDSAPASPPASWSAQDSGPREVSISVDAGASESGLDAAAQPLPISDAGALLDPDNWRSYDPDGFTAACTISDGSLTNWVCVVVGVAVVHTDYTRCQMGLGSTCSIASPYPSGGNYAGTCCSSL